MSRQAMRLSHNLHAPQAGFLLNLAYHTEYTMESINRMNAPVADNASVTPQEAMPQETMPQDAPTLPADAAAQIAAAEQELLNQQAQLAQRAAELQKKANGISVRALISGAIGVAVGLFASVKGLKDKSKLTKWGLGSVLAFVGGVATTFITGKILSGGFKSEAEAVQQEAFNLQQGAAELEQTKQVLAQQNIAAMPGAQTTSTVTDANGNVTPGPTDPALMQAAIDAGQSTTNVTTGPQGETVVSQTGHMDLHNMPHSTTSTTTTTQPVDESVPMETGVNNTQLGPFTEKMVAQGHGPGHKEHTEHHKHHEPKHHEPKLHNGHTAAVTSTQVDNSLSSHMTM